MAPKESDFVLDRLEPFAQACASAVFRAFPEWKCHARCSEELGDFELQLDVPSPHRADSVGLHMSTDSSLEYVIVGLGPGTAELADWNGDRGVDAVFEDAIQLARDIMCGRYIGVAVGLTGVLESPDAARSRTDVRYAVSWSGKNDM